MDSKAISPRIDLDELDLMLARELEVDARQTARNLAANLGVSLTTISNRIRKMVNAGAISFYAISDPRSFGFSIEAVLGLKATPGKSASVANNLASFKNAQAISLTTGRYDIVVYAIFRDNQDLLDWISGELSHVANVTAAEWITLLKTVKRSFMYLGGETTLREEIAPRCLDEPELKLVEQLELSPRESIGVLAKKIGVSRPTAAGKLKKLLNENVVKVVSIVDPPAFGFAVSVFIFVRVHFDRIVPIAETLAADRRIKHVGINLGRIDLSLHAVFRDLEEMSHFLTDELGNIPGVINHETLIEVGPSYLSFRLMR
ncbi:MAG: Lrp/AsnC family transcriptional regulator [Dehalococcoidia bacterium]